MILLNSLSSQNFFNHACLRWQRRGFHIGPRGAHDGEQPRLRVREGEARGIQMPCPCALAAELVLKSGSPGSLVQNSFSSSHPEEQWVPTASSPGHSSLVSSISSSSPVPSHTASAASPCLGSLRRYTSWGQSASYSSLTFLHISHAALEAAVLSRMPDAEGSHQVHMNSIDRVCSVSTSRDLYSPGQFLV